MERIIKTALVGFGLSGKAFHAPFIQTHPGFHLRKILERHRNESAELYPEATIVRGLEDVLADEDIELVAITTPNIYHFEMVQKCIEAGKHVIIEKPFTNTYAEAEKLIEFADKKGVKLFVYQNRRWDGDFLTIQKIFKSGVLGDIQYYEAHFDRYAPERKHAAWRDEDLPGSGILYDLGPHLIDQALVLFGEPKSISADIQSQRKGSLVDDYFNLKIGYDELSLVLTAGMLVQDPGPRYIIHGMRGSFIKYGIDPQEAALRKGKMPGGEGWGEEEPGKWGLITIDYDDLNFDGRIETEPGNYMGFYNNVYNVLVNADEQAIKPQEAARVIRIIEMAFESSRVGKSMKWK
ncbi:MAG: Gfo/Idh/MocA family oxidoreductase [Bacteroidetes bacterium]|nr:Gfo/Idh/MocA family oxidoreductase [Bacteroidota bacterium]